MIVYDTLFYVIFKMIQMLMFVCLVGFFFQLEKSFCNLYNW